MKYSILLLIGAAWMATASAQKLIEQHIDFSKKDLVVLNIQIADSIKVLTWNKNEVYVKASININDNKDNDLYKMTFGDSGSTVGVIAKLDYDKARRNGNDTGNCNCCCNGGCVRAKVSCEVYIPENTDFSVESINANIIITGQTASVRAHSISGFVDLTIAPERKADLKFNTVTGTVYTNVAMNIPSRTTRTVPTRIADQVNGGGKPIYLETISGDIFFRK